MADVFRLALSGTEKVVHSSSTMLYGALDNDDMFMYMGGLAAAIRNIDGKSPEMVVTNTRDPGKPEMTSMDKFIGTEFRSRYVNPTWIEGMKKEGYAGAGEMRAFVEYLWGWNATTPGVVDDGMWKETFDVYVEDKHKLGMKDFFETKSPYAYQDMAARMVETVRKGYWKADAATQKRLLTEYIDSVNTHGASGAEFTSGNARLSKYVIEQGKRGGHSGARARRIPAGDGKGDGCERRLHCSERRNVCAAQRCARGGRQPGRELRTCRGLGDTVGSHAARAGTGSGQGDRRPAEGISHGAATARTGSALPGAKLVRPRYPMGRPVVRHSGRRRPDRLALAATRRSLSTFTRRPQDVVLRKAVFQIHLWTGIAIGLYVFLISVTGALLVFRSELQHAAFPQFFVVSDTAGPPADIGTVLQAFTTAYSDQTISGIDTPTPSRQTFLTYVLKNGRYVAAFAHPVTAAVLGELPTDSWISRLQDLHFELLGGETGRTLNGVGAIGLAGLATTGLVIWWPGVATWRRALRVDWARNWRRVTFDLHSAIGIWAGVVVFVWGISGVYFIFSGPFRAAVNRVSALTVSPIATSNPELAGRAPQPTLAMFVDRARAASPNSELVRVLLPTSETAPFVVTMTHPGLTRAEDDGGVSFYFDRFSGDLLHSWDPFPRTAGDRFVALMAPLHIGMFGSGSLSRLAVKILWAILGLAPAALFATGAIMWWNRVVSDRWSKLKARQTAASLLTAVLLAVSTGDAAAQTNPTQISHSGRGAYEASLTPSGDGFAVAWYDTRDAGAQIYLQLMDASGRPAGAERRLTNGKSLAYEPDIQALGGDLVIAWYEKAADGALTAKVGLWTREGQPRWAGTLSASNHYGRNPVVRVLGSKVFLAWIESVSPEDQAVWAQWFDANGRVSTPAMRLAPTGATTWNLNAAIDGNGRAWVAFDARVGTSHDELYLARMDSGPQLTTTVVRLTRDDAHNSKYPDLALTGNRAALTWFDERDGNQEVYLVVAPLEELKEGLEGTATRVTKTQGNSIGAYLTWNGEQIGLAWCDDSEKGQHEIFFQKFDSAGQSLGEPRRLTRNPTSSLIPAIRPWRDGFALVWNEFAPSPRGVHAADSRSEVVFATVPGR